MKQRTESDRRSRGGGFQTLSVAAELLGLADGSLSSKDGAIEVGLVGGEELSELVLGLHGLDAGGSVGGGLKLSLACLDLIRSRPVRP